MNNRLIWLVAIGAVLLFSGEKKTSSMSGLRHKRSLRGIGARWLEPDESTLEEYEHRIKNIKRDLSPTQEKQLLSFDATGDFEYGATNLRETMRVLEEKGYLVEKNRKYWVTRKGAEYAEAHGSDILSDRFLAKEKHKKEMSPVEARDMQRQLYKGSKAVEISKRKMIPEKQGQMTLFGGLGDHTECSLYHKRLRELQDKVLEIEESYFNQYRGSWLPGAKEKRKQDFENKHISNYDNSPTIKELRNHLLPQSEKQLLAYLKVAKSPSYKRLNSEIQLIKKTCGDTYIPVAELSTTEINKRLDKLSKEKEGQMTLFGGLGNVGYRELNKITPYRWTENSQGEDVSIIDGIKVTSTTYGDNALFDVIVNGKAKTAIVQINKSSINSAIKRLVAFAKSA